jgi:hypothetical protein
VRDQWMPFQNDLIHQSALFGACLAQRDCFKCLLAPQPAEMEKV